MRRFILTTVLGGLIAAGFGGLSVSARAGDDAVGREGAAFTQCVYLCQKKDCYGRWTTVYTCYNRDVAMDWYDAQPSNARVVAVEK